MNGQCTPGLPSEGLGNTGPAHGDKACVWFGAAMSAGISLSSRKLDRGAWPSRESRQSGPPVGVHSPTRTGAPGSLGE